MNRLFGFSIGMFSMAFAGLCNVINIIIKETNGRSKKSKRECR
jgi:hypothetical protein